MSTDESIIGLLQLKVDSLTVELLKLKIDSLKEITDEKFKGSAMALVLQAEDYKRRLEGMAIEIERLRKKSDESGGQRQGAHNLWGYLVGICGITIAIFTLLRH